MRPIARIAPILSLCLVASCASDLIVECCSGGTPETGLRIINAYTSSVDILIDGNISTTDLAAGSIYSVTALAGAHNVVLRPTNGGASALYGVTVANGGVNTLAAVRSSSGALTTATLDDTNSVVAAGKTKVRVLHLAPNAGELQVYRTQPDHDQGPISWQVPFTYQASPTSLSAPFFESTVGSWEVRIWQTPASPAGWASATVKVVLPLASGQKRTILMLDKPGGGVQIEVL